MTRKLLSAMFFAVLFLASCKEDDDEVIPPVTNPPEGPSVDVNLGEMPYDSLSHYHFFVGDMASLTPNEGVLLYEPISSLFTDYAEKKRFVWMPEGEMAMYTSDHEVFDFPDGAVLIKNFYYNNVQPSGETRIIETRLLFKRNNQWEFAEYIWNEEQTEAVLNLNGAHTEVNWIDQNGLERTINYRIPSEAECLICHKLNDVPVPIGPKPQNLNSDLEYQDEIRNQLEKWASRGYLQPDYPLNIVTVPNYKDEMADLQERVRAYLDINCAHCHREGSHCSYRPMRLAYNETTDLENMGVCVEPNEFIPGQSALNYIISAGNAQRSMMWYRMNTTDEEYQMPLTGRTIVHEEGIDLIVEYINSLEDPCQ